MKCSICTQEIRKDILTGWDQGNNAEPVCYGRCCDECNVHFVIPTRIKRYLENRREN